MAQRETAVSDGVFLTSESAVEPYEGASSDANADDSVGTSQLPHQTAPTRLNHAKLGRGSLRQPCR